MEDIRGLLCRKLPVCSIPYGDMMNQMHNGLSSQVIPPIKLTVVKSILTFLGEHCLSLVEEVSVESVKDTGRKERQTSL
jgi:hypothetical protein